MRVLVVDDDLMFRSIARAKLARLGAEVDEADCGQRGLSNARAGRFDLALVDLGLPDMDGLELIRQLKDNPNTQDLPVIVVTGREDQVAIDTAFEIGAAYFLTKPINWALFRHQVSYVQRLADAELRARRSSVTLRAESRLKDTIIGRLDQALRPRARDVAECAAEVANAIGTQTPSHVTQQEALDLSAKALSLEMALADMVTFARSLSGAIDINFGTVEVRPVLNALAERYRQRPTPREIEVHVDDGLAYLDCDWQQIEGALVHLIENADRYSPPASVIGLTASRLTDGSVVLQVDDEGCGILPDRLRRLLNPVSDVRHRSPESVEFTGLGLALTRLVVEAHGGSLTIQSAVGRGTTAMLHLPADLVVSHARAA